jgi:DNA-directed RNA polymerase specialized sigma24 family protein
VPRVAGAPNPEAAAIKSLCERRRRRRSEDAAACVAASGSRGRPRVSARAWHFTATRNTILDERRSRPFDMVVNSLDDPNTHEQCTVDEVNATLGVTR